MRFSSCSMDKLLNKAPSSSYSARKGSLQACLKNRIAMPLIVLKTRRAFLTTAMLLLLVKGGFFKATAPLTFGGNLQASLCCKSRKGPIRMTEQTIVFECQRAISRLESMGSYTRFDVAETNVGYYCDDTDSAEWLRRFYAGYFVPSTTPSAHAFIYSTCNPTLLALLQTYFPYSLPLGQEEYREIALNHQSLLIHRRPAGTPTPEDVYYYLFK